MRFITFALLLIAGLGMALPGAWLVGLGGSPYNLIAGTVTLIAAVLVLRRSRLGAPLFWLLSLATIFWSLWEVGLDAWALMPRLLFFFVASLWLVLFVPRAPGRKLAAIALALAFVATAVPVTLTLMRHKPGPTNTAATPASAHPSAGDWRFYGNSQGGTRYSGLAQITPANAGRLEQAWTYRTNSGKGAGREGNLLEVTPIVVEGVMYACTGHDAIFALDPVTGKQIWRYQPDVKPIGRPVCRGVSYFQAPDGTAECPTRLLVGTTDNRLIAVDAKSGKPCLSFGVNGAVDLNAGIGDFVRGWLNPTSPPAIVRGTAVIGSYIIDGQSVNAPPGVIRGYDAVTGALKWAFDPGRPNEHGPLAPGQNYTPSTPNAWGVFSADEALGLVYLPMGMGSPDFYGRNRSKETDHFSDAVVALDADTGAVRWSYQTVHHDLWDYDLAAQPVLTDFPTPGGMVPALIQATKTGQIFVLDRRTGKPLTKVEERPVPISDIEKERTARTQPFSTSMPSFVGRPVLTEADMWGISPFDQLYCRIKFKQAKYQGMYTPMHLGTSVRLPSELGGIDWGGVSVDEGRGILVVNSSVMANYDLLVTREEANRENLYPRGSKKALESPPPPKFPGQKAAMEGTPYGTYWKAFLSPLGIPCTRPPFGYLTGVDLKTGKVLWQKTLGDASNSGPLGLKLGLPIPLGTPNIGGSTVTRGGVIFIAATQDGKFRAVDVASGKTVWQVKLSTGGHATPMTYMGRDGKQYVVLAAGGEPGWEDPKDDYLIAWRLKD
jgi:membrane-bound PQQ-dependent dehydrogenase (glucose/quinate/shikimate family)